MRTAARLRERHPAWAWREPAAASDEALLRAHTPAHLRRLEEPRDFDGDTAWLPGIATRARLSAGAAIEAARQARATGGPVFSLMRPPGHHATAGQAMGFCYLNQIAVAALAARTDPAVARVAVWDFDAHHGNGTEAILRDREGFLFSSVHQHPAYPGTGGASSGNCRNWPVAPARSSRAVSSSGAARILGSPSSPSGPTSSSCRPVSTRMRRDPLTEMTLEGEDFAQLGGWLRAAGLPAAAILEGGYSDDLPLLVEAFLSAWSPEGALRINYRPAFGWRPPFPPCR